MITPFCPAAGSSTIAVSASTSSANGTLLLTGDVRVYNSTSAIAYIKFSNTAAPTATNADIPIPAGGVEVFGTNAKYVAVILASSSGNVYFTSGRGI